MDKNALAEEISANGAKYGNEYTKLVKELIDLYDVIEKLTTSVKNANKNLVKSMIACYEGMLTKGQMGEEKLKYGTARDSFIKHSVKLNEARTLASIVEKQIEAIKAQG
ncbi:MAG: hypothetical protein IJA82_06730 [Clostridia bacterium]|nr:hypothetical protein [Clostridia bacterium]